MNACARHRQTTKCRKNLLQDIALPPDPITLLHTTRDYELLDITGGSYYRFGLKSCISQALASFDLSDHQCLADVNTVYVQINIAVRASGCSVNLTCISDE